MSFIFLPRLKMITDGEEIKSSLIGGDSELNQFRNLELLMRQLETELWLEPRRGDRFYFLHDGFSLLVVDLVFSRKT